MSLSSNRLFFALRPSSSVQDGCEKAGREINMKNVSAGRLTDPETYHLTLLFLGDSVTPEQEALALRAASRIQAMPVEFVLDHASGFKESKVWWLGMHEIPKVLLDLRAATQEAVEYVGLAFDRKRFIPHVTFLREAKTLLPIPTIQPISWANTEFVLMRTALNASARTYEILGQWPLIPSTYSAMPKEQISLL